MAIAGPTSLFTPVVADVNASQTTAPFTPVAGSMVLIEVVGRGAGTTPANFTISNTHAGTWTWVRLLTEDQGVSSASHVTSLFHAVVPASPGNGRITVTNTVATTSRWRIQGWYWTGQGPSTPTNINSATQNPIGSMAINLPRLPANESQVFAVASANVVAPNIAPVAGFTELTESGDANATSLQTQYRATPNSTSVGWTVTGGNYVSMMAVEISPPLTAVSRTLDLRRGISGKATRTLDLRRAVRKPVSRTLDLRRSVFKTVAQTLDLRRQIGSPVLQTFNMRRAIAALVSRPLDLRRTVRSFVSQPLDLRREVRAAIIQTFDARRQINALVSRSLDLRRVVNAKVSRSLDLRRVVQVDGKVSRILDLRRTILVPVSSVLDLRRAIAGPVSRTLDLRRAVLVPVSRSLDLRRAIRETVSRTLDLRRAINAPVSRALDLRRVINARVRSTLELQRRYEDYQAPVFNQGAAKAFRPKVQKKPEPKLQLPPMAHTPAPTGPALKAPRPIPITPAELKYLDSRRMTPAPQPAIQGQERMNAQIAAAMRARAPASKPTPPVDPMTAMTRALKLRR